MFRFHEIVYKVTYMSSVVILRVIKFTLGLQSSSGWVYFVSLYLLKTDCPKFDLALLIVQCNVWHAFEALCFSYVPIEYFKGI